MRPDNESNRQNPPADEDRSLLQRVFGRSETSDADDRDGDAADTVYRGTAEPVAPNEQRYTEAHARAEHQARAEQQAGAEQRAGADQGVGPGRQVAAGQQVVAAHQQPDQTAWQQPTDANQAAWREQQARAAQEARAEGQARPDQADWQAQQTAAQMQRNQPLSDQRIASDQHAAADQRSGTVPTALVVAIWSEDAAREFRERWRDAQLRFVDDPRQAAEDARGLVNELVEALTASLASHRQQLNAWQAGGDTEQYRVIVQRYRTFFDRLLTL